MTGVDDETNIMNISSVYLLLTLASSLYRLGVLPLQRKATDEQKEYLKEAMSIWKDLYNTTGDIVYKKNYDFAKKALRR